MTVDEYITAFDLEYDHDHSNSTLLKWINLLESNVYDDIMKDYDVQYYARVLDEYQYDLPSGVNITDVASVYVNGIKYRKKDVRAHNNYRSYWYEDSKLCIYPACTATDSSYVSAAGDITFKAIEYTSGAGEITFASGTITTTGDSFVTAGFVVGNSITISNCTDNTSNNKTVVITGVTADTITVASGSFTAGTEPGTIKIKTNCIYTAGSDFSGFSVDDIVNVSGCTDETANNKYATIIAVADDVLTFAEDTFTAQAESASVTITAPKIKMTYITIPEWKVIGDISTDELTLPDRFVDAYDYFIMSKIAYLEKEFAEAQNHMAMCERRIREFEEWYDDHRPSIPDDSIVALEDGELYQDENLDFDEC